MSSIRSFHPRAEIFSRPTSSIPALMSTPVTCASRPIRTASMAKSAVPVATSRRRLGDSLRKIRIQDFLHITSMPREKKWFRKSYRCAMPSNMRATWFFLASWSGETYGVIRVPMETVLKNKQVGTRGGSTHHGVALGVFEMRLRCSSAHSEGHRQRSDTPNKHGDRQDHFSPRA